MVYPRSHKGGEDDAKGRRLDDEHSPASGLHERRGTSRTSPSRRESGAIKRWGWNAYGQLGEGDTLDRGGAAGDMGDNLRPVDLGLN